ncbi:MAG: NAD-dependent epimerase/dehydratase family protein [Candidatus Binatia bacterium]
MRSLLSTGFIIVAELLLRTSVDTSAFCPWPTVKKDKRIFITGGTGFVGSHLIDSLCHRGIMPRVLVRSPRFVPELTEKGAECVVGGLDDVEKLANSLGGIDTIFHLAALTRARSEKEYQQVNTQGTRILVEAIQRAHPRPRRLVYVSSLAASGPAMSGVPSCLQDEPRPITAYGRSKLAGEAACLAAASDLEVFILRPPAVYGPRDRDLFRCFQLAMYGILPVPTGPERWLQFIHVHDLVSALLCAATTQRTAGIYYVAESQPYAWGEISHWLAKAIGRQVHAIRIPAWGIRAAATASELGAAMVGRATIFNREKAEELLAPGWLCETETVKRDLGFEVQIPLPQGLTDTASWYRTQGWL